MSCGVGCRCGSNLALLWLWYRPAAVALIRPLAWETPYAAGAALKVKKQKDLVYVYMLSCIIYHIYVVCVYMSIRLIYVHIYTHIKYIRI